MIPRSPTRWEREQKATFLSLLVLVGLVLLAAFCRAPSKESAVAHEAAARGASTPTEEGR